MTEAPLANTALEELVGQVADDIMERRRRGEQPDVEEYAARYPEIASVLRDMFPALLEIGQLGSAAGAASRAAPPGLPEEGQSGSVSSVLGDFRILREVGRGGMGIVYEAEQVSLGRRVALKVLPLAATMDTRQLQRFQNEARAAAGLHHTNIVPVHFVGCERGVHYYAMQFIEGRDLASVIAERREPSSHKVPESRDVATVDAANGAALTPCASPAAATKPLAGPSTERSTKSAEHFRAVARLGIQAAEALDHAHQMGIVHRDVKPANLLVDDAGRLWITDFGLAQFQSDTRLTMTGDLVGTLRYMSPEQALAKRVVVDHRTDIYSLGATLYELLTLQPAFPGNDRQELLRQIAFEEPEAPRRVNGAIPREFETIVLKALERNPAERYATAQELADDLRRFLEDKPIQARRPSLLQRARKWARRHRAGVVAATSVLLLSLTILAAGAGWLARDYAGRRTETERAVTAALTKSTFWQEQRRLPEALSAARRAVGVADGGTADDALRRRVQERLADLELLERLENIRLEKLTAATDGYLDGKGADAAYGQTFREAGLDVESLPAEAAAERIGRSTVAVELAAVLDHWALVRRWIKGADDPSWIALLRVARLADDDAWRTRVRAAVEKKDGAVLRELAASEDVFGLPVATLSVLGSMLMRDKDTRGPAEVFLREAQRRHPNDFWLNAYLGQLFLRMQPPQREEAVRFATVAVSLRPASPFAHTILGNALTNKGRLEEAIAEYKQALALDPKGALHHSNLGVAFTAKGRVDDAIAEHKQALALDPKGALAHYNLGVAFTAKGRVDDAIAEYKRAIDIDPNFATAHYNLGNALKDKGRLDDAVAEYQKAISIDPKHANAHYNLGHVLGLKGQLDDAIAEYQEAIDIDPRFAAFHNGLGSALAAKGRLDDAIAHFKEAIRLKTDLAEVYCNLGLALRDQGRFADALVQFRRGHELGSKNPNWPHPSARLVKKCERLVELDGKLPAILKGLMQPADTAECLALAELCRMPCKKHYAAAQRFYSEALAAEPKLAGNLNAQHRYSAACAAALAGCGQGADADKLDEEERTRLRQQALDWLRADLKAYRQAMDQSAAKVRAAVAQRMRHWQQDKDFVGVRDPKALAQLPEAEHQEWQKLWQEVEALRTSAADP
jgi:serine/threonine protein kinase/tetratricopeptide (TPR) repeat protein